MTRHRDIMLCVHASRLTRMSKRKAQTTYLCKICGYKIRMGEATVWMHLSSWNGKPKGLKVCTDCGARIARLLIGHYINLVNGLEFPIDGD